MLKLRLQYFGHLMRKTDSLEKTLMLGRSPGGGHGNPLQCSCLENPHGQMSLVGYSPWGRKESDRTEQLTHVQQLAYMADSIEGGLPLGRGLTMKLVSSHPTASGPPACSGFLVSRTPG